MRIVIFGAEGQLGRDLQTALGRHAVTPLSHADADIVDEAAVRDAVTRVAPDWVVNAASMTHVDRCESDAISAFKANAVGAGNVARACASAHAGLVHVSTDYVFDGRKMAPYLETDPTRPLNVYGVSKLAGEYLACNAHDETYIVRTSGLYGAHPCRGKGGKNFVETMLHLAGERSSLRVVDDEVLTPTFTEDLAAQLTRLVESGAPWGIYHTTNAGECSWYEFATEIFRLAGIHVTLEKTTAASWNAPARRPAYSVLENAALVDNGIDVLPDWKDALRRYMAGRGSSQPRG
jgi:dTDP-4-dehydrorhamnose reductase